MAGNSTRILIVEPQQLLRDGVCTLLEQCGHLHVAGSVSSAEECINIFRSVKPDITLVSFPLVGVSGLEAIRWIKGQNPTTRVILITAAETKDQLTALIQSGIEGCLPREIDGPTLLRAIECVAAGKRFFHRAIAPFMLGDLFINKTRKLQGKKTSKGRGLTSRETEVLALVASGKRMRQVADELLISVKTVETHKANIHAKLGLRKTAELVHYAIKKRLIEVN